MGAPVSNPRLRHYSRVLVVWMRETRERVICEAHAAASPGISRPGDRRFLRAVRGACSGRNRAAVIDFKNISYSPEPVLSCAIPRLAASKPHPNPRKAAAPTLPSFPLPAGPPPASPPPAQSDTHQPQTPSATAMPHHPAHPSPAELPSFVFCHKLLTGERVAAMIYPSIHI